MNVRALGQWLVALVCAVSGVGLCAELFADGALKPYLSLSYEGNIPTWFATLLLFSSALAAASIAQGAELFKRHWWGVVAVFVYASLDEATELHEHMGGNFSFGGVLYFDWVIPAAAVVVVLAVVFWPFVRALEASTRWRLIVAGAIYLGGAVGMELPLGWVTDRMGTDSMGYSIVDWVEETMELAGAAMALHTLVRHREGAPPQIAVASVEPPAPLEHKYIVGPIYDWVFFLGSPMLSLALGIVVSDSWLTTETRSLGPETDTMVGFFIGTVIHAHLVAVFFRSHGNAQIRKLYPIRFLVVPIVLYAAIMLSPWIAVASTVVATFWDVWHSGAQTFGFARIYDRNHGTPPELGRKLDFWLHQLLYAGPILAGATLMDHFRSFDSFNDIGDAVFSSVPAHVEGVSRTLTWAVLALGSAFLVFYVLMYWRLAQRGYKPPWLKVWLVVSTGFVSIYTWGFNSWGTAFLIMNLFHGVQYMALVWAMEGKRISQLMRMPKRVALVIYLASLFAYGLGVQALDADIKVLWAITMVVSIMHFWYDAFVWSVRKKQI